MKNKIKEYINFFATTPIKQRGSKLYTNDAVEYIGYDQKSNTELFKVQGTKLYDVSISLPKKPDGFIVTSCTCPYTWGKVCKHVVASLLYLSDTLEDEPSDKPLKKPKTQKKKVQKMSYRTANEQVIIKDYNKLDKFSLSKYLQGEKEYLLFSRFVFKNLNHNDNNIVFNIIDNDRWDSKSYSVTCIFKSGDIHMLSDEYTKTEKGKLKQTEKYVLLFIYKYKDTFFSIVDKELRKDYQKQITDNFGLPASEFDKYFIFDFDEKNGLIAHRLKRAEGLITIDKYSPFGKLISKVTQTPFEGIIPDNSKKNRVLGFVLRFNRYTKTYSYTTIAGKPNKQQTKLSSRIEEYDRDVDDDVWVTPEQEKIDRLIDDYYDLANDDASYEAYFNLSKKIFNELLHQKFIYRTSDSIRKNDLEPVKLSNDFVKTFLVVTEDQQFVKVNVLLKIDGKPVNRKKIDEVNSDNKMICYNNTLYHLDSAKDGYLFFNIKPDTKIIKAYKDVLYEKLLAPLSKEYEIEFNDVFKVDAVALDYKKKQVYLSEEDQYIIIKLQVVYDNNVEVLLTSSGDIISKNEETNELIKYVRNKELESDFVEEIAALHPDFEEQKLNNFFYIHFEDFVNEMWFYKFFEYLNTHQIEVFGVKDLKNFKYSPHKAKVNTAVSSGQDWFDVEVEVRFGNDFVSLSDIRKAIVNKQKYIQLKDGSVGILPDEWLHKLEKYFRNTSKIEGDTLHISKMRFSIIDELFDNIDDLQILEEIARKKQRLKSFTQIQKVKVPTTIKAKLRPYQKEGLNWLHFLDEMQWGGILADDMGLGKTLQVLAFIQKIVRKDKTPNLVVVPTTLLFNWQKEIEKFAPKIKAYYHYGTNRERNIQAFAGNHIVFTTYGTLMRDIEWLREFKFNYAILDESQAIKNPASRRYKAVNLLQTNNRIVMTGTPIENSTFDLYAQMSFVNPGFFMGIKHFKETYSNPIDKDGNEQVALELQKLINPFILRRTKEKVASELPPKVEDVIYCEMEPEQRKVYEAYRNKYRNKILEQIEKTGVAKSKFMVLEALTRLRQICDSPALLNDESIGVTNAIKIQEIVSHITDKTANHKLLIFSQFTSMLALLKTELEQLNIDYEYLDGKSNTKQRENSVQRFQNDPDLRVFLISLKAGGTGLNLTAADYVYILDPWWNPAVENQAIDRIYRIGQDKKVFAYRMICKDTVEEKILDLQAKKKKIATDIIRTDENIMKTLDVNDIKNLLD